MRLLLFSSQHYNIVCDYYKYDNVHVSMLVILRSEFLFPFLCNSTKPEVRLTYAKRAAEGYFNKQLLC